MLRNIFIACLVLFSMGSSAEPLSDRLVQLEGKFISVQQTSMRAPYWVFSFHAEFELNGLNQRKTPIDKLFQFAVHMDFEGQELLVKLSRDGNTGSIEKLVKLLPESSSFQLVLMLLKSDEDFGGALINAEFVGSPVHVRQ
jgi:hypothetical protein